MKPKQAPKPGSPVAKPTKRAGGPKMTDVEQSAEFERVAREHGAEGDEETFKGVLRKLTKSRVSKR